MLVLEHSDIAHESLVFDIVILTVALSVVLHGLTALPGVNTYAAALKICKARGDDISAEQHSVKAMPLRLSGNKTSTENVLNDN